MCQGNLWRAIYSYNVDILMVDDFNYSKFNTIDIVTVRISLNKWYLAVNRCTMVWSSIIIAIKQCALDSSSELNAVFFVDNFNCRGYLRRVYVLAESKELTCKPRKGLKPWPHILPDL